MNTVLNVIATLIFVVGMSLLFIQRLPEIYRAGMGIAATGAILSLWLIMYAI